MAEERNPLPPPPSPLGNDSMGTVAVLPTAADIQSAVASTAKLQQNHHEHGNKGMTREDVIDECRLFYIAGQETTSLLLTWMHPNWQVRAREEVLQVCGKCIPSLDSLSHLKTVSMILNEVLRLYPPVVSTARRTSNTVKLGDFTVPEGVRLVLPLLLIHHDRKLWGDDAQEFNPERFSEGIANASKNQLAFFPFSWGPRICIGQTFALIEAKMALAMILQRFSFELSPTYVHASHSIITLQPQYGAQIILHSLWFGRSSSSRW